MIPAQLSRHDILYRYRSVKVMHNAFGFRPETAITPEAQLVRAAGPNFPKYRHDWCNVSAGAAADRQDLCHHPLLLLVVYVLYRPTAETLGPTPLQ